MVGATENNSTHPPLKTMTSQPDSMDTELSLDELKGLAGGLNKPSQTTPQAKSPGSHDASNDGFTGFPDLYDL